MFSLTEIAKLQAAGYSLDDILAANTSAAAEDPAPAQAPDPAPAEDPAPAPAAAVDPAPAADPMSAMTAKLDELIQQIRASNIRGTEFPAPQPETSVEEVLARIINPQPPAKGRK